MDSEKQVCYCNRPIERSGGRVKIYRNEIFIWKKDKTPVPWNDCNDLKLKHTKQPCEELSWPLRFSNNDQKLSRMRDQ